MATKLGRLTLLATFWLGLCGGVASAQEEMRGLTIRAIEFEKLKRLDKNILINRIDSRVGEGFDPLTLSEDIIKLHALGEFDSPDEGIPPVEARTERLAGGGVRITFIVFERRLITSLKVNGAENYKSGEITDSLRSKVGRSYDRYTSKSDSERLCAALRKRGYLYAEVTPRATENALGIDLIYDTRSGPRTTIDGYEFLGTSILSDTDDFVDESAFDLKPRTFFGLGEDGYFVQEKLDGDIRKLERYYRSKGFLDAQATLENLRFTTDREEVTIQIRVIEGERYTIRKVELRGNKVFEDAELRKKLKLQPGRPFLGNDLLADTEAIRKVYATKAYIHAEARFDVSYDRDRKLLDIIFTISEGPQVRVGRIIFEGNEKTKQKVIRRALSLYPGELYDGDKLEQSLGRLGRSRYFEDIKLEFRPSTIAETEDLVLKLKESRTGSFVIGGGLSSNSGFFANFVLNQRNFDITEPPTSISDFVEGRAFTGGGQNFTLSAQPGRQRSQYRASFTDPYFLDSNFIFGVDGFIFDRFRRQYREGRLGGFLSLGYRLTQDLILQPGYRFEQVRIFDFDFDAIPDAVRVAGNNYISGAELALILDRNLVDTSFVQYAGYSFRTSYEVLGGYFGGDVSLTRARASANWQTTLFEFPKRYKWVFGLRGETSWQEAYGADRETPIYERFFAGGVRSFRGFQFRSISPRDRLQTDEPVGGDFELLGTADVSFPLFRQFLRGVVFVDGGTVERDIGALRTESFRLTAGFGFRLNVALFPAPVALDFGFPLKTRRFDDEQIFSFSVGVGF